MRRIKWFLLLLHVVTLLLFIPFRNKLECDLPFGGNWILTAPITITQCLPLFAISCGLILLYTFKQSTFKNNHHIISLSIVIMFISAIIIRRKHYFYQFNFDQFHPNVFVVWITIFFSTITLKQWLNYLDVVNLHKIFTNNKNEEYKYSKTLLLTLYLLYNIIVNYYCLFYIEKDIVFNFAQYISWMLILTLFSIPYYIMPDNLKYDLYCIKIKITAIHFGSFFLCIWQLLWFYNLKYSISHILCHIVFVLIGSFLIMVRTILPTIFEWKKQHQFIKKCRANNHDILWSNYIISHNSANYKQFFEFLATAYCAPDFLFIIDIIKYKNKLQQIYNTNDIDYGYLLPFHMMNGNEILPTSPIVTYLDNIINHNINREVIVNIIRDDFEHFVDKYIQKKGSLNISLITRKESELIINKLRNEMTTNIIMSFDKALIEINEILQILYREYQLQL